jgi:anthranilate phosphoribosyltransferase
VYDPALTEPLARVLGELGARAALVVHGHGGADELNTSGPNRVSHLRDGAVRTYDFDPAGLGFERAPLGELRGGSPDENANTLRAVLSGQLDGARRSAVLLNAAAAIAAETGDFPEAVAEARAALDSGAALGKLDALVAYSQAHVQNA